MQYGKPTPWTCTLSIEHPPSRAHINFGLFQRMATLTTRSFWKDQVYEVIYHLKKSNVIFEEALG